MHKRILKFFRIFITALVVAIAAVMTVFTVLSVALFDQTDRSLLGYKAFIILSDSMKQTDFSAGDLALVRQVDPSTLQEGDIIAYISRNSNSFGKTITHKIRAVTRSADGEPGFITYGTTSGTDDEAVVTYPYILGKYEMHIPKLGLFFQFLKTVPGYLVCIFLPFMLLIVSEIIRCAGLLRRHRLQQQSQLQAEREQIEAQRAQAQQLMQQVMEMKAQIEAQGAASLPDTSQV